MILPEINSAQDKILSGIANGRIDIPSSAGGLISLLESFRVAYNYDKHEEGLMFHSAEAFLKTLTRLGGKDELGFAYISSVMQVVEKRKSFKDLSSSTKNRGIKASRHLVKYLIEKKWIAVHGNQARITVSGTLELDHMEFVNQY
ncbi:hypothetical protein MAELSTROM_61 [Pseudoalteromonas phage Maelstrom]|uniref:hypothetical protein n=1 Tax=Pseudoalteromonas phage Maelstrom TaxID=2065202 RepID=UPI000CA3A0C4|nr:hypothetical protein PP584_gp61 [Pseudoalteromonas phage Maelstrom]AUG84980.1 hypothetical protein MAELSTROM_61 [Pseudoalteromonas phage Maelstrom]